MKNLSQRMGQVVRGLRLDSGLSQESFAGRSGLHRTYIGCIERGEKSITIDTAQKLAQAFDISLSELFKKLEDEETDDRC